MRILALTKYKGTQYAGWQRQPNALSIQQVIEEQLSKYFNREITIYGAGRTDAGVHALGQRFHFDVDVDELDIDRLIYSLNKMLPDDISIEDHINMYINNGESSMNAIKMVAKERNMKKNEVYSIYQSMKGNDK